MKWTITGEHAPPFFLGWLAFLALAGSAVAQSTPATLPPPSEVLHPPSQAVVPTTLSDVVRLALLDSLKDKYVDERNWGGSVERWDGLRVRGWEISRRKKEVPHGAWQRYQTFLLRPDETLKVDVTQEDPAPDGSIPFTIVLSLRARCEATFMLWTYGVKGVNGTSVADATIRMRLVLKSKSQVKFSWSDPLPRLELRPTVQSVELRLVDLDARQLGVIRGDMAKVLGDGSRAAIDQLLQKQEGKIKERLQKQINAAVGAKPEVAPAK